MANFFDDPGTSPDPGFPPPAASSLLTWARRSRPGLPRVRSPAAWWALSWPAGVGFAAGRLAANGPDHGPDHSRDGDGGSKPLLRP